MSSAKCLKNREPPSLTVKRQVTQIASGIVASSKARFEATHKGPSSRAASKPNRPCAPTSDGDGVVNCWAMRFAGLYAPG